MKRRAALGTALFATLLFGLIYYFYGGSQTPAGQPPLVNLTSANFPRLKEAFNQSPHAVRILILLSPT